MNALAPDVLAPDALDWEQIFISYHHRIRGFIRQRVNDRIDAEDLASETFTRAIAATQRGKGPRDDCALSWLFQIARNLCVDYYRTRGKLPLTVEIDAAVHEDNDGYDPRAVAETVMALEPSPHELAEQTITSQRVRGAVGRLTHHQERVTTLRLDGYEFGEIAAEIDKSVGAAKALQHRAYVELQRHLKGANA